MTECCNSYGTCTQGQDCPAREAATVAPKRNPVRKYTYAQLGVCQGHQPPCIGCFDERDTVAAMQIQGDGNPSYVVTRAETITYWGCQIVTAVVTVAVVAGSLGYLITRLGG